MSIYAATALRLINLSLGGELPMAAKNTTDRVKRMTVKPPVPRPLREGAPACGRHMASWAKYGKTGCKLCDAGVK